MQEIDLFIASCGGDMSRKTARAQSQSSDLGKCKAQEADAVPKFKGQESTQPKSLGDE
jgi:hypothetical protein